MLPYFHLFSLCSCVYSRMVTLAPRPGLQVDLINKHLPPSTCTAQGHIAQEKQHSGVRNTRFRLKDDIQEDAFPSSSAPEKFDTLSSLLCVQSK